MGESSGEERFWDIEWVVSAMSPACHRDEGGSGGGTLWIMHRCLQGAGFILGFVCTQPYLWLLHPSVQGQVGRVLDPPGLVEGVPAVNEMSF